MTSHTRTSRQVHNAAQWRKRLRRELQRVGANNVSLYIDGRRGIARLRFPDRAGQFSVRLDDALQSLHGLPDGAGVERTVESMTQT